MKTLRLIGMALFAVFMCVNFASCNNDDGIENQDPKKYTISLSCVGEILDVSYEPLSRGNTYISYEVSVFADGEKYATGSFNDLDNATVDLIEGKTYSFMVSYSPSSTKAPTEQFDYSVGSSNSSTVYHLDCYYKGIYYYGFYEGYEPTQNGEIEIDMKQMSFILNLKAKNLAEGASINTTLKRTSSDTTTKAPQTLTSTSDNVQEYYYFSNNTWDDVYNGVLENGSYVNYFETAKLGISLTRVDGKTVSLGTYDIKIERNKKINITINAGEKDTAISNGFTISFESENLTDGGSYEID